MRATPYNTEHRNAERVHVRIKLRAITHTLDAHSAAGHAPKGDGVVHPCTKSSYNTTLSRRDLRHRDDCYIITRTDNTMSYGGIIARFLEREHGLGRGSEKGAEEKRRKGGLGWGGRGMHRAKGET